MNVTVIGNLCSAPRLDTTPSGVTFTELRIAENRRTRDRAGEWQTDTSFYTVVCWRDLADRVNRSVAKGDRISVTGRMFEDTWTTDTGARRSRMLIEAHDVAISLRFVTAQINRTPATEPDVVYGPLDPRRPFEVNT